ncbi:PAS domain-containing sensor histidine kinase [uncultured Parabacteroides sp.]|uniref:PAS domain-containing sensor histidine kinase n=1 Tax=uncultured Parabacteroides sp. TaxID=512312 RepID=UPI0026305950|nr:PAS domain-containing sensor histidine kinase [uncultured Parabacteroides sp.]
MDEISVKQILLSDFFTYYPAGGALYDESGALLEMNRTLCEKFGVEDQHDFILNNLFDTDYLTDLQKNHLKNGSVLADNHPIGYTIIPGFDTEGNIIGYTLLLTDSHFADPDMIRYDKKMRELKYISDKVVQSVPDTIILINDRLVVERIITYASETCITPAALNRRIDDLPGFIYPDPVKRRVASMVQKSLDTSEVLNIEFSIPGHNAPIVHFKLRLVPIRHKYVVAYIRNVSDIVEKEKENRSLTHQLSESRSMMELALHNSHIATYSFNFELFRACDKEHCNHCFQFYGVNNHLLERNRYICRSLSVLRHPEDRQDFFLLFNEIRDKDLEEYSVNFRLKSDDGNYRSYEVIGKAFEKDKEGKTNLIVGCVIDNQKHVEYEESLIKAKEKAENADLLKSTFLANVTHEIRTPLNAIVGFSDLLSQEEDPELRESYTNLIKANNELLLNLVNDVLDISKIESDMLTFNYADNHLPSVMHDIYKTMQFRVPESVTLILDPCPEITLNMDKNRMMQVLINLLTNAAKYTETGSIRFGCGIREDFVHFYVTDTGSGIPESELGNIFGRFVQLKGNKQGIGLGLAICKGLVTKMGGTISATSKVGKGSTFNFTLPLHP